MKATDMIKGNEEAVRNISGLYQSRMNRRMKQKELSQLSGIPTAEIRRYEFHKYLPRVKNYNKLAKVFGWEQIPITHPETQSEAPNPKHSYVRLEDLPPPKYEPIKLPRPVKFEFEKDHCYVITDNSPIKNIHHFQAVHVCVFKYEGKQGIHHMFREISGNWTRTYTDAQLIGKRISEVKS